MISNRYSGHYWSDCSSQVLDEWHKAPQQGCCTAPRRSLCVASSKDQASKKNLAQWYSSVVLPGLLVAGRREADTFSHHLLPGPKARQGDGEALQQREESKGLISQDWKSSTCVVSRLVR